MDAKLLRTFMLGGMVSFLPIGYGAQAAGGVVISSVLECSALSTNKKFDRFATALSLSFSNNSFKGERATDKQPGKEVYSGSIENNVIKIFGRGAYKSGSSVWRLSFFGPLDVREATVLKGYLETDKTRGRRDCTITLLLPPDKLAAVLAPSALTSSAPSNGLVIGQINSLAQQQDNTKKQLADMAEDLKKKQKAIQESQDELKLRQSEAARDLVKNEKVLRATLAATSDLNEKQKTLESRHDIISSEQSKTSDNVNMVQILLDGIILPTTEDPNSWMLRVAAVPVQQQQFCRIVDQFYDGIKNVSLTNNEIKKNLLYRDRQLSMAALLPHGEFANWVLRVKEVTQAPDGSAAVMLQPPCRAMLGSDACQKNGSKIAATIQPNSATYRELGLVSSGDFVVVSGKVLYAEPNDAKPLPTYAVYQAGSHCSMTEGSKQEDVFVTEINYLVQLR